VTDIRIAATARTRIRFCAVSYDFSSSHHFVYHSDVNKDWTCKDKDKDLNLVLKDKHKDFTYSYLLQVAAKPTIAIKQQQ